ncbi:dTMP kinase [Streptomyces sp. ISL-11]|uniref:dTMP kinase n=1 Tax=Streptomyces sp. ISL-11 TaxID=2819174 RepID=UPI001BE76AB6|nr:dTMP kinase [Streptomyces sp. ISL-11]MBT2383020.1 dTMP kinase [Streptomyces sp. ISL-11]
MTRAEQPTVETPTSGALAADSRERAVRALLRIPPLRRLWSAQVVGGVGDSLALLVLLALSLQASVVTGAFGGGYRGAALAVAAVLGTRLLATLIFGAVLLGPVASLIAPAGPLDRRWTMIGADGVRFALLVAAPLWIDWTESRASALLLVSAFLLGVAERFWTVAKDGAAPALLPAPPAEGASVRPLPDHYDALRRLSLRTNFVTLPAAAAALVVITLVSNLFGSGIDWFHEHQVAMGSFLAAGLFATSVAILYALELPGARSPRVRSPLEGLRRPKTPTQGPDTGRTGAIPVLVLACAAVAGAIASAVGVAALQAVDLGGGPVAFGLLVLALGGGPVIGIRSARKILPGFSRRRLLALALALTGLTLLAAGLVPDPTTVLLLILLAGIGAGVVANTGHALLDQETEESRRARTTDHLHAVVRVSAALGAVVAPLLAAAIGPHRLESGSFVFAHGGAAFTLMLVGALLLPVGAIVLGKTDDRHGVPFRRDLMDVLRGGDPEQALSGTGFFIAFEGGDGAGKSTQVQAVADWIRAKGHEVVVTREPGATAIGKRLRAILLDVGSAGLSDRAEALLYAADRAQHVDSVVRPALERGAVVITDRYIDSSVAYQGAGRDLSPTEIARISRWATAGLVPHLTVLLDVSPETARERFTEAPDRLESEPAEFHQRVRTGFLTLAAADPSRYLVVDAGQEPEAVSTVVRHRLDQLLPLSEAEIERREQARKAAEEEARRRAEEEAARKAEEERLERERQAMLAKLRAEEEERKRRELEEARRREEERLAEEARQRAEEARRLAEEERKRREAEERTRAAEQERLRKQAEEEARLRAEAEERRLERQRKAEEALLRAEEARVAAAQAAAEAQAAASAAAGAGGGAGVGEPGGSSEAPTVERPSFRKPEPGDGGSDGGSDAGSGAGSGESSASDDTRTLRKPVLGRPDPRTVDRTPTVERPRIDPRTVSRVAPASPEEETTVLPPVAIERPRPPRITWGMEKQRPADASDSEETTVLPQPAPAAPGTEGETEVLPPVRAESAGDADETAVLPPVRGEEPPSGPVSASGDAEETAVLPPVPSERPERSGAGSDPARPRRVERPANPTERVPHWLFRPEDAGSAPAPADSDSEITRELPQLGEDPSGAAGRGARNRPGWADDAPTLADELLGPRGDDPRGADRENGRDGDGDGDSGGRRKG